MAQGQKCVTVYAMLFISYFHFVALVSSQSAELTSATQHALRPEFGGKWGTERLNKEWKYKFK